MSSLTGRYQDRAVVWHDIGVENCEVCGRLILRRVWLFEDPRRGPMRACGPDCESLWFRYLEPRLSAASGSLGRGAFAESNQGNSPH
jgi:hypothetical protein